MKRILCIILTHRFTYIAHAHRYPGGYWVCLRCHKRQDKRPFIRRLRRKLEELF